MSPEPAEKVNSPIITTVLMIRHADVHNPDNIVYGRLPRFRLSEIGRSQIERLARGLAGIKVDAVYTSPMLRARQTAGVLAGQVQARRIRTSNLITEVRTGFEGRSNSTISGKMNFYDTPADPDDETIPMIARRMSRFLRIAHHRHFGQTIIGVSHADPIMILRAATLGLPLTIKSIQGRYYPAKCSIMQFSFVGTGDRPIVIYREIIKDETARSRDQASKTEEPVTEDVT